MNLCYVAWWCCDIVKHVKQFEEYVLLKTTQAMSSTRWFLDSSGSALKMRNFVTRELYSILDISIGDMCGAGDGIKGKVPWCCCCGSEVPIYKYTDTPEYLHGNPYVVSGYRVQLSFLHCVKSMFAWTNDTINIWSHFIGFFIFFYYLVYDNVYALPHKKEYILDHVFVSLGLICYLFCMFCSTGYHLFRGHSEQAHMQWLALDLTGISVGLLGCYLPGIHYGFYCLSVSILGCTHVLFFNQICLLEMLNFFFCIELCISYYNCVILNFACVVMHGIFRIFHVLLCTSCFLLV